MMSILVVSLIFSAVVSAQPMPYEEMTTIASTFAGRIGRSPHNPYLVQKGSFAFQSIPSDCDSTKNCMGGSKLSPVGLFLVPFSHEETKRNIVDRKASCLKSFMCGGGQSDSLSAAFRIEKEEAIVLIGMTPPDQASYSINSLLFSRHVQTHPSTSTDTTIQSNLFAESCVGSTKTVEGRCVMLAPISSLSSDTTSTSSVSVEKMKWRGVYDQPIAIIFSPSKNATERMKMGLIDAGINSASINILPLPTSNLYLSLKETADMFSINVKLHGNPKNHLVTKKYISDVPFHLYRFTPMPEDGQAISEGEEDTMKQLEHLQKEHATFSWNEVLKAKDQSGTPVTELEVKQETYLESETLHPMDLNVMLDILENEIVRSISEFNIITQLGAPLINTKSISGHQCITHNLICKGRPHWDPSSLIVSHNAKTIVLGGGVRAATSILLYGVLHQATNLTNQRVIVTVTDETTGEQILTLDERTFAFSTRKMLRNTGGNNAPVYFLKFALGRNQKGGCKKTDSNCFTLGATRKGRKLRIEERIVVPLTSSGDETRRNMVKGRIMITYTNHGQKSALLPRDEESFVPVVKYKQVDTGPTDEKSEEL